MQLSHRAHGRARSTHWTVLINSNRREDTFNFFDLGFIHAVEKLPRISREALDVPPLSLGIEDIKGETRLPRTADSSHYRQLVQWDFDIDIFEVVLLCAGNRNRIDSVVGVPYFVGAHPRPPLSSS